MADFVLVHGGMHGGWCFAPLEQELRKLGHATFAPDLPIGDVGKTTKDYADALVTWMRDRVGERPWLVGHSLGGFVVPRAALKRTVGGLIYLCAGLPPRTEAEHKDNLEAFGQSDPPQYIWDDQERINMGLQDAVQRFYHDCTSDQQLWAWGHLRPQWFGAFRDFVAIERYPDVPTHAILTTEDAMLNPHRYTDLFQRRLGITPVLLPGSHSPFLSRPAELARVLDGFVKR